MDDWDGDGDGGQSGTLRELCLFTLNNVLFIFYPHIFIFGIKAPVSIRSLRYDSSKLLLSIKQTGAHKKDN